MVTILMLKPYKELDTKKAKIIVPQAVADKMPKEFTAQLGILNNGESKERYGITIEASYPYHFRGRPENGDVVKFKELVNAGNKAIEVVQLDWYPNDDF